MILSDGTDTREMYRGSGKFEGESPFVGWLYDHALDAVDQETGEMDWDAWVGRIGRRLVIEDSFGFIGYRRYPTENEAREAFYDVDRAYSEWLDATE